MNKFQELGLNDSLISAISELNFIDPTPIQEKTIPAILNSNTDIIGLAQTGTGKTAGFGLPVLQKIDPNVKSVQSIVLCPTRELCVQITKDLKAYSKHLKGISVVPVYGGASIEPQINALKRGAHIVVGTPGRTLDLIKRKSLKIHNINWLILDEADEMLNMGFKDDLDAILQDTPKGKQTLLFSATMPKGIRHIANNYMNDPVEISAGKKNIGASNVEHQYYMVKASDRYLALKRIADINPNIYGIIFCRTRHETKDVAAKFMADGYNADALHGDLSQSQRDYVMDRFRKRHLQLLIATDVAARGLDINDLTHVINYNLPDDPEVYIHRSGRTGRAGKKGIAINICHSKDGRKISEIEKLSGKKFERKQVPSGNDICEKQLYSLMDKIERIEVDEEQIAPYIEAINKKLAWLDREELLKRFISVEFNRFLEYYKKAKDINLPENDRSNRRDRDNNKRDDFRGKRQSSKGRFSRIFINIGSKHNVKAPNLIGLVNEKTRNRNIEIGKIEILRNFSFFEVEKDFEHQVLDGFRNSNFGGTKLNVEVSKPTQEKRDFEKSDFKRKGKKRNKAY